MGRIVLRLGANCPDTEISHPAFLLEPGRRDLYSAILIFVPAISFTGFTKDY